MICAGVDAGSRAIKVALFDTEQGRVVASGIADQGVEQDRLAEKLYVEVLGQVGLDRSRVAAVVATGYGRNAVRFANTTITEITCHARGTHHLEPEARTIVEIGGQDSKLIVLENGGQVRDFVMNDRCAAGSGRFLEVVAARLEVSLAKLGELSQESREPALISNMCVVFAETEVIGLLASGKAPSDIAAGIQNAIATRLASMSGGMVQPPVCFTGGVALQAGMGHALEQALGCPVRIAPLPQYTGAIGAALLASNLPRGGKRPA